MRNQRRALLAIVVGIILIFPTVLVTNALLPVCAQPTRSATPTVTIEKTEAAGRLAEAVRFRTISPEDARDFDPQPFQALHNYLERVFPLVHRTLERQIISGLSLLYTWKGQDRTLKPVLLLGHLDVVPVDSASEPRWTYPPFAGRIADGYVWGRGTLDDKSAVVGILEAVGLLLAQGFQPTRTVQVAFGHDEEIGGQFGAKQIAALFRSRGATFEYLLDEGLFVGSGIIPGAAQPLAMVGIAEKGRLALELSAAGAAGHASMPPTTSAIGTLSAALVRLDTNPMPASVRPPVRQLLACAAPSMGFARRLILSNLWLFERLVTWQLAQNPSTNAAVRTTSAVTVVQGGTKANVLPSEARAIVDVRILPGDTSADVFAHIRRVVGSPSVSVHILTASEPSPLASVNTPEYGLLTRTIREVFPDATVAPGLMIAATDSRHYLDLTVSVYRFLPVRFNREDLARFHGDDERISIDAYADAVTFYSQLIRNSGTSTGKDSR